MPTRDSSCTRAHNHAVLVLDLSAALAEAHLNAHDSAATQVRERTVDSLHVAAQPLGKLALGAANATVKHGLARNESQQVTLGFRKVSAVLDGMGLKSTVLLARGGGVI